MGFSGSGSGSLTLSVVVWFSTWGVSGLVSSGWVWLHAAKLSKNSKLSRRQSARFMVESSLYKLSAGISLPTNQKFTELYCFLQGIFKNGKVRSKNSTREKSCRRFDFCVGFCTLIELLDQKHLICDTHILPHHLEEETERYPGKSQQEAPTMLHH